MKIRSVGALQIQNSADVIYGGSLFGMNPRHLGMNADSAKTAKVHFLLPLSTNRERIEVKTTRLSFYQLRPLRVPFWVRKGPLSAPSVSLSLGSLH